jgi:DNA-binding response OmpR family regulator
MPKILIVDDDRDIVEAIEILLKNFNYETDFAYNRQDGEKKVFEGNPDLIILDVMMEEPDDGIALSRDLRKKGFNKPIIMLTSLGKVTGFNYGKDDSLIPVDVFHEKPIAPDKLISTIKQLLQGR